MRSRVRLLPVLLVASCGGSGEVPLPKITNLPPPRASSGAPVLLPPEAGQGEGPRGTAGAGADSRYDEVGLATWYGEETGGGPTALGTPFRPEAITAAHRTLPLGSFAEVTALDTGRTILVLINDRGPAGDDRLIDLSRGAAALLGTGANPKAPVRVRAVTAAPEDVVALSAGRAAAPRLFAPPGLLTALRHKLTTLPEPPSPSTTAVTATRKPRPKPTPVARTSVEKPVTARRYLVQVAAFSTEARARALATRLNGRVEGGGGLWRVRLGPFADSNAARRARDGAAGRGYGDAAIIIQ